MILYIFAIVYLTTMMGNMSDEIKATKLPSAFVLFASFRKLMCKVWSPLAACLGFGFIVAFPFPNQYHKPRPHRPNPPPLAAAPGRMPGVRLYCCF